MGGLTYLVGIVTLDLPQRVLDGESCDGGEEKGLSLGVMLRGVSLWTNRSKGK